MSHGAITQFRRQYLAILRRCAQVNAMGWMACGVASGLTLLGGAAVAGAAGSPGIVTDGRTQTTVSGAGTAVVTVSTGSVQGANAFNSFTHFNVNQGQTVNLMLPQGTQNLLNLVRGSTSYIDGVLNAYKEGRLGGNVFFLNPHGVVVGAGGQVNVGSLMLATPTQDFMNQLLDESGQVGQAALAATLRGDIPISSTGLISVKGRIRAADGAVLSAGHVEVGAGGLVQAGPAARVAFGQLVNVSGLAAGGASFVEGDTVRIVSAGDVVLAGQVSADGAAGQQAGQVQVRAAGNVTLADGARVSADGQGAGSHGGRIDIWADGSARHERGALLSARGADEGGDGGHIELSAKQTVTLAGGGFAVGALQGRAGSVLIDPNDIEVVAHSVFTDGGNYTLVANDRITVGEGVVLSTRNVANPETADHETAASEGDSGNLTLNASHIDIQRGAKLLAHATGAYKAGDITILARHVNAIGADRTASASVRIDRATVRGGQILIRSEADTSGIAVLLAQSPSTTLAEAQKFVDNELDSLSDGPGGEFLAVKTQATARTEVRGSRIVGSGDVTIESTAAARAGFEKDALAETIIGDAPAAGGQPAVATVISGRNVKIDARASTSYTLNVLGSLAKLADRSWLPSDDATLKTLNDQLFDFSSVPLVSLSKVKGAVRIDGATAITATGDLTVHSEAVSAAKPSFASPLLFSAAWAESTAESSTQVLGQTTLTAGGAAQVQASTDVEVNVTATVNSTNKPVDAVFVYADNQATTTAETGAGTRIRAGSVEVSAANTSDLSVSGTAANTGGSGLGIAVAVNQSRNTVRATMGGDVASSSGDVDVKASIDMAKNTTAADASTLGNPSSLSAKMTNFTAGIQRNVSSGLLGATGKLSSGTADKVSNVLFPGLKEGKLNLSGAVAYNDSSNLAQASIADDAQVQSARQLNVLADVKDRPTSTVGAKTTSTGTAIGGAVALANFQNQAQAWIGKRAQVDAKGALTVDAQTRVPYAWQIDWSKPDDILNHLQGNVLDLVFTSFGLNAASGKNGAGVAAAVTVFDMDNTARAWVDEGAKVNTVFSPAAMSLPDQSVTVHAKNDVNAVHAVGIAGKKVLGTTGGKAAIGGSANVIELDTTAEALILGGADVRAAQGVTVKAEQTTQLVSVAEAGGSSDNVGVEGAVGVHLIKQRTLAGIDDDATVRAGGPVTVQALGDFEDITVAGGVVATKGQVGIGFAVSVNQVDTATTALIGNVDAAGRDAAGAQGAVRTGGALTVKADAQTEVGAYSVAGAIATSSKAQTDAPAAGDSSTQTGSSGAGSGKFGIAVSGDASYNDITADTTAAITDGAQVLQAGDVAVQAHNTLALNALAGAVTISTQQNGNGLAGSFAYNHLGGSTSAYVKDARVQGSGAMQVTAQVDGEIKTLSASVQASRGKVGVAGSVSINEIGHWTQAYVSGSDLSGLSGLSLSAQDSAAIRSVAGALALGGKAGVGLSFGWNHIDNRVMAQLLSSDVQTGGAVTVQARSDAEIDTAAASLGVSTGQMAAAGAVAINQIDTQTTAHVGGTRGQGVQAASLKVAAVDASSIQSLVGALGLSAGKAGFGVSFAWNQIGAGVKAELSQARVRTSGATLVSAAHDGVIETLAMGGGGSAKVGVSGSLAVNDIGSQVQARSDRSDVTAQGIAIEASDRSTISALTGALSGGGSAAVGASGSYNHLSGAVKAEVLGGSLRSQAGSVTVDAVRRGKVDVWAASGAGGGTAGFAGSIAINDLGGETTAGVAGGAQVLADHNVGVTAQSDDRILAKAGTVALGGTVGGGGAIALNDIHHATTAEVSGSGTTVNALAQGSDSLSVDNGRLAAGKLSDELGSRQQQDAVKGTAVVASSTSQVQSILANVAGGGEAGVAATVSVNMLGGSTTAQVSDGAAVQADATGASAQQQARVGAYHHDVVQAGAGGLAVGGTAGVGGAVDTTVLSHTTRAQVQSASVAARQDVDVKARHTADTQQIVVGASGGGVAAANLSGTVLLAKMQTEALADRATLRAQRNVTVQADSRLSAEHLVGGLDVSGAAGFGASVIVTVAEQQTRAATLGATAIDASGVTTVAAGSEQSVTVKGATGSGSGGVGIAGTVAVTLLKGQTDAAVDGASEINTHTAPGQSGQDVVVQATDTLAVDNKLGALGVGLSGGGVGATADVTLVKSGTSARIGAGAKVHADRDIRVASQTTRELKSLTVAASGGLTFGISGAVSYIGAGGRADSDAQSELLGSVGEASRISSGGLFGGQAGSDAGGTQASTQRANTARGGMNLTQDFSTAPAGTSASATVGQGATLTAGRDVAVTASTQTDVQATAAGVAVSGGVSLGGGVAIARLDDQTLARVSGDVTAAGQVRIGALDGHGSQSRLASYAGGGGLVGLGASVTLLNKTASAVAELGADARVQAGGAVAIDAALSHDLKTEALGAAVGLAGVGAAIAYTNNEGVATARVGERAQVNAASLDVHGHSQTTSVAEATAAAGGIVSGAGADAKATDRASAQALLGEAVRVRTPGGVTQVRADIDPATRAKALGAAVSAGVSIGVSLAKADAGGRAVAATGAQLDAQGGDFLLKAQTLQRGGGVRTAQADATAAAGGALLGAGATEADAIVQTSTQATLGQGAQVRTTGDLQVDATSSTWTQASSTGVNVGLLAGGSNRATSRANSVTQASVADGAQLQAGDELNVRATGRDVLRADTEAGAGGLGTLVASKAETQATAQTGAALGSLAGTGGSAQARALDVSATQTTDFNATADSVNASVVGYSGARTANTVQTDTRASVGKAFQVQAQAVQVQAVNHVVKSALAGGYNVDSASGGLLNGAAARSESLIRNHAIVSIGEGAQITVNVPGLAAYGSFNLSALNDVSARDSVRLDSGGAIAVARSESEIRNDVNEGKVLIGASAILLSDGEVNASARTQSDVRTEARSKTYGLAGAAQGDTLSFIGADNQVNVATGALVQGERDVRLMAGTDRAGAGNQLNADADTRLWNRTALPIETDPDAHAEINQSNTVNVAAGAQVRSVRSVYLNAEEGTHTTRGFGEGTDAYREVLSAIGAFFGADTSALKISGGSTWDNARNPLTPPSGVTVEGSVEAGIWHHQYLTFGPNGEVSKSENVSFTLRDQVKLADLLSAEIQKLKDKAAKVRAAANNYSGDANAADVADALDNDARILEAQLAALGGNTRVNFLDVAPVLATTGNVHITGRYLSGGGALTAPGDVRIDIENQSTRFMTTSALTIPDEDGGQVTFNGLRASSAGDFNARNATGRQTTVTVKDALTTPAPVIRVVNTNGTDTATGSPAQLWLLGDISNLGGLAQAKSHGTIRASGNIHAETVDIATGGDFIKTYTPGFTHQGGNPISQLGNLPGERENSAMGLGGSDAVDSSTGDYSSNNPPRNCGTDVCSSTIAGNNVYISGEKLNINGLIQAGLEERRIVIDPGMVSSKASQIAQGKAAYQASPNTAARYIDLNNPEPGSSDILVRYDLATDRLDLGNVRIGGGHMELYGNIFSTGNGELRVLDGYGRIGVTNTSGYDMVINRLDAGQGVEGKIRITDTGKRVLGIGQVDASGTRTDGKALVTEITRLGNSVQTRDSRTVDADGKPTYLVSQEDGRTSRYDPVANRRFNWINGRTQTWTEKRKYTQKIALGADWLAPDYDDPDEVIAGTPTYTARLTGDWLSVGGGSEGYRMDYTQVTSSKALKPGYPQLISRTCIGVCGAALYEEIKSEADFGWTVQEYFHHSLAASKSIKVSFTGYDTAKVDVTATNSKVLLNGMVRGLTGETTLSAAKGIESLSDDAVIVAQRLSLTSSQGAIGSAASPVRINLTDIDASRGLVNGSVTASARDGVALFETDGDLRIAAVQATAGALNLTADRHLLTTDPNVVLRGTDIRLRSLNGTIGTAASPLRVDTQGLQSVLSAEAAGDIRLTEVSGDLRVEQIRSRTGDVYLNVPTGSLIDANEVDREDTKSTSELLALWDSMRLRGNLAEASADQTVRNEERRVTAEYQRYWQLRNVKDLGGGNFTADAYDPNFRFTLSAAQASALKSANGWSDADVARYEQAQTTAFHQAHARFGAQAYSAAFQYKATDAEVATLRDGAVWTDRQLSTALGAGLFRPVSDTETRIEDANVVGRNLVFNVSGSIGQDAGVLSISRQRDTSTLTKDERLALLTAEKQDLTLTGTEIRIAQKKDFDIQASGTLTATATGPVLIGSEDDVRVAKVQSQDEVRIKTGAGLINAAATGEAAVVAKRLVLEAGQGSIGTALNPMLVDVVGGPITARARQDIYLGQRQADFIVGSVYAPRTAVLTTPGAILDGGRDKQLDVQAKDLNLVAGTTIGQPGGANEALEVSTGLNGVLNASAPGGVYLSGMGASSTLGEVRTQGDFSFFAVSSDLTVGGTLQARRISLAADDDLVFGAQGRAIASESVDLLAGADGQGSIVAVAGTRASVSAPRVHAEAADTVGQGAPLRVDSPDVTLQGRDLNASLHSDTLLTVSASGPQGLPAQSVSLDIDAVQGTTLSLLNAEQSTVRTNGPLTVREGLLRDVARFFTPYYSIRVDASDRRAQPGFDVRAFTLTGRYDLVVTPDAALIGAYVLTGNPTKVIFSNPGGVSTGDGQSRTGLNSQRDQAGARSLALARGVQGNFAPAAGLLRIGDDLFSCEGREQACAELELAPPAAGQ